MITLTGTLRQSGTVSFEGKEKLKLWVEHETPRENGANDLKIEELFVPMDCKDKLPAAGAQISVTVRPYVLGKGVKFQAIGLAPQSPPPMEKPLKAA